jgi:hypothetical protein
MNFKELHGQLLRCRSSGYARETFPIWRYPSIVIITARMLGSQVLICAIRHGVYERAFAGATRRLQIVESGLGDDAVAVGAAALARDGFLGTAGRVASSRGVAVSSATW